MKMSRVWAMPNPDTFDCPPLGAFVRRYLAESRVSADCFARNRRWATHTNDLDPSTTADHHIQAEHFIASLDGADLWIVDPPYSPRQIKEVYGSIGLTVTMQDTQTAALYRRVREAINQRAVPGDVALWFGWNSVGQCKPWTLIEILLVCHGGAHNDTIATAWRLDGRSLHAGT